MLVSQNLSELKSHIEKLRLRKNAALDTETFGLGWEDEMFALIIGNDEFQLYFNFYDGLDHLGARADYHHSQSEVGSALAPLLSDPEMTWFLHNAKFDLRRLHLAGMTLAGDIHDTEVADRIIHNDHMTYSLDAVAKRWGFTKSEVVEEYIATHQLFTWADIPGKKKREKNKHFEKVPFPIMHNYACQDIIATYGVGEGQVRAIGL